AWSRRRWLEATQPAWTQLVEPVAERVVAAMGEAIPEEMRAMAGPLLGVMQQVGGVMFGGQLGQAVGMLAKEVVSSTDIGLPLGPAGVAALLPEGVEAFGAGLQVPAEEVRLFLALREGWVDTVTLAAATPTLPSIASLNETMRRRRASGGPAEQTFAALVGLELRPRRLRDASALWALLETRRGVEGRDAVWGHPD